MCLYLHVSPSETQYNHSIRSYLTNIYICFKTTYWYISLNYVITKRRYFRRRVCPLVPQFVKVFNMHCCGFGRKKIIFFCCQVEVQEQCTDFLIPCYHLQDYPVHQEYYPADPEARPLVTCLSFQWWHNHFLYHSQHYLTKQVSNPLFMFLVSSEIPPIILINSK